MTTVLVTGAGGALGRAVASRLATGSTVIGVGRATPATAVQGCTRFIHADVRDASWSDLLGGVDHVIHLAAFVHRPVISGSQERELEQTNVCATQRLAAACRSAGVRLVFASSVAVYGRRSVPMSEATDLQPDTAYGRSKRDAERAIAEEVGVGLDAAVLRLPLLYGPNGRGNIERMLVAISRGRYWPLGDPTVQKTCLYMEDAAAAIASATTTRVRGTFNVAPRVAPTLGDIHAASYAAVGRRLPPHVPVRVARAAAYAADATLRVVRKRPRVADLVETLTSRIVVDGQRFASATGFADATTLAEGMRATARVLGVAT